MDGAVFYSGLGFDATNLYMSLRPPSYQAKGTQVPILHISRERMAVVVLVRKADCSTHRLMQHHN